jgi:hypothetical protein
MTTHVTIYRDSLGLPTWATVVGADPEHDMTLLNELRRGILNNETVFGFDGDIEVEVV